MKRWDYRHIQEGGLAQTTLLHLRMCRKFQQTHLRESQLPYRRDASRDKELF